MRTELRNAGFRALIVVSLIVWLCAVYASRRIDAQQPHSAPDKSHSNASFRTADACIACHNGITTASGEDVSMGADWRGSMMANSSRDPYWYASVRRETIDHPQAAVDIQDTCAVCHMPMSRAQAASASRKGLVFAHLPVRSRSRPEDRLAHDGVSCTMCHQITERGLGSADSFNGGFVLQRQPPSDAGSILGPFTVDAGRTTVMQSASDYRPAEAAHIRKSELCATCHTQFTRALGPRGETIGRLPEQTPFLEWRHSAFRDEQSCQSCHMPVVREQLPMTSVMGIPRDGVSRHAFQGGNFFVLGMLNRYRADLGVQATAAELQASMQHSTKLLQSDTATVSIDRTERTGTRLDVDVGVTNLSGHKLPTGFPSRRAWIHLTARDAAGRIIFQSGAPADDGRIEGNDNDADPKRFEPHFTTIRRGDEVQIYESVIGDVNGNVTTGLLSGVRYLKDNRLLPKGFDKASAGPDIAVAGDAAGDVDFVGGSDHVRYAIDLPADGGPVVVDVEFRFQPVGFRWARNLAEYASDETRQFGRYYDAMASASSIVLAHTSTTIR